MGGVRTAVRRTARAPLQGAARPCVGSNPGGQAGVSPDRARLQETTEPSGLEIGSIEWWEKGRG